MATAEHTKNWLKKVRLVELKTRGLSDHVFRWRVPFGFSGRGMTFSEVREYQPGDEGGTIDWNDGLRQALREGVRGGAGTDRDVAADLSGSQEFGTVHQLKRSPSPRFSHARLQRHQEQRQGGAVLSPTAWRSSSHPRRAAATSWHHPRTDRVPAGEYRYQRGAAPATWTRATRSEASPSDQRPDGQWL